MATITTGGSGNWSSGDGVGPWTGTTKPVNGDVVEIAAGHTVTLDENTATLGAAGIKNVSGSNTSVLDINGTVTINGNVSHSGTATSGFITLGTGDALTITGQVTNSSSGYAIVGAGSAACTITNTGATAINNTGGGRGVSWGSSGTLTVNDTVANTSYGSCVYNSTGTVNFNGDVTCFSSSNTGAGANCAGGTANFAGRLLSSGYGRAATLHSMTANWTGTHTYSATDYCHILMAGTAIFNMGTAGTALNLTMSGQFVLSYAAGTLTTTYCTITRQVTGAGVAFIGVAAGVPAVGPALPTEANVWTGSGTYGYAGDLKTPTKRASSITVTGGAGATLSAPDVKSGVVVDDVTGNYAGGSGGGLPILGGSVVR